jgi:nucleotide-binding universal stress UspA family protein
MIPIRTILCPTDFSEIADRGVELASDFARLFGAELILAHNLDPILAMYFGGGDLAPQAMIAREEDRARAAEARLRDLLGGLSAGVRSGVRVTTGQAHSSILALARELPADLIVMGTHGRSGLGRFFIGSVTERVVAGASCPVVALRDAEQYGRFRALVSGDRKDDSLVVPIDFSPHSLHTVEQAFRLLEMLPVRLLLLHVVERVSWPEFQAFRVTSARERLETLVPDALADRISVHMRAGTAAEEISRFADLMGARLVVMGAHPKGMIDELLFGATSKEVLRTSPCPVWVVPPLLPARDRVIEEVAEVVAG